MRHQLSLLAIIGLGLVNGCGGEELSGDPQFGEQQQAVAPPGLLPPCSAGDPSCCPSGVCPDDFNPCGDGLITGNEACDGSNLNGHGCKEFGYDGGVLFCNSTCTGFDKSGCTKNQYICGDGYVVPGEACDGKNLGGKSCRGLGYDGGSLACNGNCTLNTSACYRCGDGKRSTGEACEGTDLGGWTCAKLGANGLAYTGGTLKCSSICTLDVSGCVTRITVSNLGTPFFVPPWTGQGDREFGGNGPIVNAKATIYASGATIWARLYMFAVESYDDRTKAEGTADYPIYTHFKPIQRIVSDVFSEVWYMDSNGGFGLIQTHSPDLFTLPEGELVNTFYCIGDTQGDDAGINTGFRVTFNPISFEVGP